MSAEPLTSANFGETIAANPMVLVDFWASWCGPCQQFAPIYEAAAEANPDVFFGSINTEEERELSGAAGITSIPTLMAFKEGIMVFNQAGALPAAALAQVIAGLKALDMDEVRAELAKANDTPPAE